MQSHGGVLEPHSLPIVFAPVRGRQPKHELTLCKGFMMSTGHLCVVVCCCCLVEGKENAFHVHAGCTVGTMVATGS